MDLQNQAALKIQRAWKRYWICPYCGEYGCWGIYSEFSCPIEWPEWELAKLDARLDRRAGIRW